MRALYVLALVALTACPTVWVKERSITLSKAEPGCMVVALSKVPEVSADKYRDDPVMFYLRRAGTYKTIATIGTPVSGGSEIVFLIPPDMKAELIRTELDSVAANLEKACGA